MKFLVVFACALAAASAGFLNGQHAIYPAQLATPVYGGPQHLPVIGANGVPVDTPAVQTAKAAHLVAKAEAHARNGDFVQGVAVQGLATPVVSTYAKSFVAPAVAPLTPTYAGPQHLPVIGANGVPVDTPAVQSAKVAHSVHKAEAYARNGDYVQQAVAPIVASVAAPVSTFSGAVAPVYTGPQNLPVIGANGVPVDTPAVQTAKAAHFVAKAEAHARNGDFVQGVVAPVVSTYAAAPVVSTYSTKAFAPLVSTYASTPAVSTYATKTFSPSYATGPVVSTYTTKTISPVVGQISAAYPSTVYPASINGVPLETPEVLAAKANHFAAHAQALSRSRRGVYSPVAYSTYGAYGAYGAYPYVTPFVRY